MYYNEYTRNKIKHTNVPDIKTNTRTIGQSLKIRLKWRIIVGLKKETNWVEEWFVEGMKIEVVGSVEDWFV